MKTLITILLLMISFLGKAQNEKPERAAFVLKLAVTKKNFYEQNIPVSPYFVHEKLLQIYPTEKLFIEVEIAGDTISVMKVVKENLKPESTIEIVFTQNVKDKASESMMLKVNNPFNRKLSYKAFMSVVGSNRWTATSIIPVEPKIGGYEMWNDVIVSLALDKWKLE